MRPISMFSLRRTRRSSIARAWSSPTVVPPVVAEVGDRLDQLYELLGLGDEVGLALELDDRCGCLVPGHRDGSLGVLTVGALSRLGKALLAEPLAGGIEVSVVLHERLLGVHHPRTSGLAQGLHVFGSERHLRA